jgi:hypothetical protein
MELPAKVDAGSGAARREVARVVQRLGCGEGVQRAYGYVGGGREQKNES